MNIMLSVVCDFFLELADPGFSVQCVLDLVLCNSNPCWKQHGSGSHLGGY